MPRTAGHSIDLYSAVHGMSSDIYLSLVGAALTGVVDTGVSIFPGRGLSDPYSQPFFLRPGQTSNWRGNCGILVIDQDCRSLGPVYSSAGNWEVSVPGGLARAA